MNLPRETSAEPVDLRQVQRELRPSELLVDMFRQSSLLRTALTHKHRAPIHAASSDELAQAQPSIVRDVKQKTDLLLAQQLFK